MRKVSTTRPKGTLRLSGTDAGGSPRVADAEIEIEGAAIDVTLQGRRMAARGNVRTLLRPGAAKNRLPGLLQQGQPANVSANTLEYDGDAGKAVYTGAAALWQGETAIRGNTIALDQTRGDLVATGAARSTVALDTGASVGSANEIRYTDSGAYADVRESASAEAGRASRGRSAGRRRAAGRRGTTCCPGSLRAVTNERPAGRRHRHAN